jgi:murein DD-endopeptidase MepM/ murein hydrolase activator NlpD
MVSSTDGGSFSRDIALTRDKSALGDIAFVDSTLGDSAFVDSVLVDSALVDSASRDLGLADHDLAKRPWVAITSPKDGAEVRNPVTISFTASPSVVEVTLKADGWKLHNGRLPASVGSHSYSFSGTDKARLVVLTGFDAAGKELATTQVTITPKSGRVFPIADKPGLILSAFDNSSSSASFGAGRSNGRIHAGCDLYWTPDGGLSYKTSYRAYNDNTPIYAVADGTIVDFSYFYQGTYALVVDHGEFTIRYGEVDGNLPAGISVGAKVKAGQQIAIMGDLDLNSGIWSMLHFEIYSNDKTGPLTNTQNRSYLNVPNANYQRRADLMDCRPFLRGLHP